MNIPAWFLRLLCVLAFPLLTREADAAVARPIAIVEHHQSNWQIVSCTTSAAKLNWAASELQKYLQQMSGCLLPVVAEPGRKPALVLGLRQELSPEDRALLPAPAAGYDGYAVVIQPATRQTPARIVIAGDNAPGVIYGVYDLLERFGCRWFYPTEDPADPEVVPALKTLSLPAGSWAVASPMRYRICNGSEWFFEIEPFPALKRLDWAMKARYNAIGWQGDTQTPLEIQYRQLGASGLLG